MQQAMLSRRKLIWAAIGVGGAQLGERAPFFAALADRAAPICGHGPLAALCVDLHCPETIRGACLRGLPATEASPEHLALLILAGLSSAGEDLNSAIGLRLAIRDQIRRDFSTGKIANVDGWMLSVTETRIYALTALIANELPGRKSA